MRRLDLKLNLEERKPYLKNKKYIYLVLFYKIHNNK